MKGLGGKLKKETYKVLIVEDEIFVRLGIKMSVEWEKLGMEVIGDAENGKQALEIYEKERPDIILTDLKMPVMDGMGLIRRIREKDHTTRIVILSCLEEFHLVQQAISMDVSDYILKLTMTQEDMEKVLRKVKGELDIIKERKSYGAEYQEEDRKKYLRDFFYYDTFDRENLKMKFEKMGMPFGEKNLAMAILEIDAYEQLRQRFKDEYGILVSSAFTNVLNELLQEFGNGMVIEEKEKRYILIAEQGDVERKSDAERFWEQFLGRIKRTLAVYFRTDVTIGVSRLCDGYENLRDMYQQCSYCLERKFYHSGGEIMLFPDIKREKKEEIVREKLTRLEREKIGDERMWALIGQGLEAFLHNPDKEILVHYFVHLIHLEVDNVIMEGHQRFLLTNEYTRQIEQAENLDQLIKVYLDLRYQLYENPQGQKMNKTVSSIISYISKNYGRNMPLEEIADAVGLSPNYICSLFKKEMGVNLFNYIMEYRINRAKELLMSTNMKSYEIADQTGFSDESYFSRSFKRITGQSPIEFKRSVFRREED